MSETAIQVRRVRSSEVELFRRVRLAALEDSPDAFGETLAAAQQSDWDERTVTGASLADRAAFMALSGARAIGMVFVNCGAEAEPAFLGGMWIEPAFRRRGVGQRLVQAALDFLKRAGQRRVSLWVTSGHASVFAFYSSLGFRQTGATSRLRPGSELVIHELLLAID